jgi:3-isopropylmalate/(R)-2-methylmalate dehydratase small subunit
VARIIDLIEGTAIPMRGDDIDTDRIMPARFLRSVRFEGLEEHLFEDDRRALAGASPGHPFGNPAFRGASILIVNRNFGSGSSREHAPQGLQRWGIRAIVGESFSEIFFGNSMALGLPCVTAGREDIRDLMDAVEHRPSTRVSVRVGDLTVECGGRTFAVRIPDASRDALLTGAWDATGMLLERFEEVEAVAARLPYLGWAPGADR